MNANPPAAGARRRTFPVAHPSASRLAGAAWACTLFLAAVPLGAHAHGPHEHGRAALEVVIDGDTATFALRVPADDVVGFEHAPRTDAQRQRVEEALTRLRDASSVLEMPADAGCSSTSAEVRIEGIEAKGTHAEFEADYGYRCTDIDRLRSVSLRLWKSMPSLRIVQARWVAGNRDGSQRLSPRAPELRLAR